MGNSVSSYMILFLVIIGILTNFSGCVEKTEAPTPTPTITPTITSIWSKGWSKTTNESEKEESVQSPTPSLTVEGIPEETTTTDDALFQEMRKSSTPSATTPVQESELQQVKTLIWSEKDFEETYKKLENAVFAEIHSYPKDPNLSSPFYEGAYPCVRRYRVI